MSTPEPAATATPKSAAKKDAEAGAEYVVLIRTDARNSTLGTASTWQEVKTVAARSADAAVKEAAEEVPGRYVAVPARSWSPRTVTVEQTTRIRLT